MYSDSNLIAVVPSGKELRIVEYSRTYSSQTKEREHIKLVTESGYNYQQLMDILSDTSVISIYSTLPVAPTDYDSNPVKNLIESFEGYIIDITPTYDSVLSNYTVYIFKESETDTSLDELSKNIQVTQQSIIMG